MTQYGYEPLSPEDSGSTLLERLNGLVPALLTNHKGAARPAYIQPGMMWMDDSGATWLLNVYDGTGDVALARIDPASHAIVDLYLKLDGSQALTEAQKSALQTALGVPSSKAVGTKASKRNRFPNPAFQICQDRSGGASIDLSFPAYVMDGVIVFLVGGGSMTFRQAGKSSPGGSPYRFRGSVLTVDAAIAAGDVYGVSTMVEGIDVADLQFGTPNAKSFVWRGVVNLPVGTYGLSFYSSQGAMRSYVTTFTIAPAQAGTDVLVSAVVPGDTSGTWLKDASGIGMDVRISLGAGVNFQTNNTGVWQAGNFHATPAQTNFMATAGATFELADIGLYAGTDLPEWEMQSFADDLRKCQRYYQVGYYVWRGQVAATGTYGGSNPFCVLMRATPSVSTTTTAATNFPATNSNVAGASPQQVDLTRIANATGTGLFADLWIANARL